MSRSQGIFGCILSFWTFFTVGCLVISVANFFSDRAAGQSSFCGDVDMGKAIVFLAAILNIPTVVFWLLVLWTEQKSKKIGSVSV